MADHSGVLLPETSLSDMKLILPDLFKHIKGLLVMESKKLPIATRILRDGSMTLLLIWFAGYVAKSYIVWFFV